MLTGGTMPVSVTAYCIRLEGVRFRARHGASRAERDLLQDFVVDLEVALPIDALPASDKRSSVFDYDALASLIVAEGTRTSCKLLETLARRLLERVLSDTAATAATVWLRKFGPPTKTSVDTVSIELSGSAELRATARNGSKGAAGADGSPRRNGPTRRRGSRSPARS